MGWIAIGALVALVGWIWISKPVFPARLFFNSEPVSYETQRGKWLGMFGICLLLLVAAAGFKWIVAALLPSR